MSFYRSLLAGLAALVIAAPVFAEDSTQTTGDNQTTTMSADQQGTTAEMTKVNINKATAKELMQVKGLTSSKAKAIVSYRKKHGDFKSVDELANVKGFKKMTTDKMKGLTDQMTIE